MKREGDKVRMAVEMPLTDNKNESAYVRHKRKRKTTARNVIDGKPDNKSYRKSSVNKREDMIGYKKKTKTKGTRKSRSKSDAGIDKITKSNKKLKNSKYTKARIKKANSINKHKKISSKNESNIKTSKHPRVSKMDRLNAKSKKPLKKDKTDKKTKTGKKNKTKRKETNKAKTKEEKNKEDDKELLDSKEAPDFVIRINPKKVSEPNINTDHYAEYAQNDPYHSPKREESNPDDEIFSIPSIKPPTRKTERSLVKNIKHSRKSIDFRKSINVGESIEIALLTRRSSVRRSNSKFSANKMTKNKSVNLLYRNKMSREDANAFLAGIEAEREQKGLESPSFNPPPEENKEFKFDVINLQSQGNFINQSDAFYGERTGVHSPDFNTVHNNEETEEKEGNSNLFNDIDIVKEEEEENFPVSPDFNNNENFKGNQFTGKDVTESDNVNLDLKVSGVNKKKEPEEKLIFINKFEEDSDEDENIFGTNRENIEDSKLNVSKSKYDKVEGFPGSSKKDDEPKPSIEKTIGFN